MSYIFSPESAYRLNHWEQRYGAFLIDDPVEAYKVFLSYQPSWIGKYATYNVMFDIGIYVGEYVISKRPQIHWEMYKGHEIEPETFGSIGYQRPCLAGFAGGGNPDAIGLGLKYSAELRQYTDIGGHQYVPNHQIIDSLKNDLYLATLTEEQSRTLPMRDLRHDRLE